MTMTQAPKNSASGETNHTGTWLAIGLAIGSGLGVVLGTTVNIAFLPIGIGAGLSIGLAIGASLDRQNRETGTSPDNDVDDGLQEGRLP